MARTTLALLAVIGIANAAWLSPAGAAEQPAAPDATAPPAAAPIYRYPMRQLGAIHTINRAIKDVVVADVVISMVSQTADRKARTWRVRAGFRNPTRRTVAPSAALVLYKGQEMWGDLTLLDGSAPIQAQSKVSVEKLAQMPASVTPDAFGITEETTAVRAARSAAAKPTAPATGQAGAPAPGGAAQPGRPAGGTGGRPHPARPLPSGGRRRH